MTTNIGMINMDKEINGYRYERNNELITRIKNTRDQQSQYEDIRLYSNKACKDILTTKIRDNKDYINTPEEPGPGP